MLLLLDIPVDSDTASILWVDDSGEILHTEQYLPWDDRWDGGDWDLLNINRNFTLQWWVKNGEPGDRCEILAVFPDQVE